MNIRNSIFFVIIFFFNSLPSSLQAEKRAILIGVGDYPTSSGWSPLSSKNDVLLLNETLIRQGFKKENILTIVDNEATKKNILATLNHMQTQLNPGDILFFHFSGHGQQMDDDNGDEIDGYDEALVPIDALKKFVSGSYEGVNHIRDDELEVIFNNFRNKLGPVGHLFVLIDACHSGTGTRGILTARGTDQIMGKSSESRNIVGKKDTLIFSHYAGKDISAMVSFFSSAPNQLSYEYKGEDGQPYGLKTYSFVKALNEMNEANNYFHLFQRILQFTGAKTNLQTPTAEGDLEMKIFDGNIVSVPKSFKILAHNAPNNITIDAGELQGILPGSEFALYRYDILDIKGIEPLAKGHCTFSSVWDADIDLDRNIDADSTFFYRAHVLKYNYGKTSAALYIKAVDVAQDREIKEILSTYTYINYTEKPEELILEWVQEKELNHWQLSTVFGQKLLKVPADKSKYHISQKLVQEITRWIRANFLKKMTIIDENINAKLTILSPHLDFKNGLQTLIVGDSIQLVLQNTGSTPFYFSLIDIQPDNVINNLLPYKNENTDYYLMPGKTYNSDKMAVGPPLGMDIVKIIATKTPIDISLIIGNKNRNTRSINGHSHPFEVLMDAAFNEDGVTRGHTTGVSLNSGMVSNLILEIVER